MSGLATIKKPTEGCEPPAGVKPYGSRALIKVATASTKRQSTSAVTRTRSQEKSTTRLFTLKSPFLVPILMTVTAASRPVRSLSRARTWKGASVSVYLALLPLMGCAGRALVVVNLGIANKTAAALAAPFDVSAYCAALARQGYIVKLKSSDRASTEIAPENADKICREVWLEELKEQKAKEAR
jgi:hypothetical protein